MPSPEEYPKTFRRIHYDMRKIFMVDLHLFLVFEPGVYASRWIERVASAASCHWNALACKYGVRDRRP